MGKIHSRTHTQGNSKIIKTDNINNEMNRLTDSATPFIILKNLDFKL